MGQRQWVPTAAALRRLAVDSRLPALYLPLLMPGLGIQPGDGRPQESSVALQRHIALVGEAAHGVTPGRRACDVGFVLELATILRARWGHDRLPDPLAGQPMQCSG